MLESTSTSNYKNPARGYELPNAQATHSTTSPGYLNVQQQQPQQYRKETEFRDENEIYQNLPPPQVLIIEQEPTPQPLENRPSKKKKKRHDGYGWPKFPTFTYRIIPDFVGWLFGCYGYMLGKFPYLFLILGLVCGGVASAGLMFFQVDGETDGLINEFLEEGSRYFTDDDIIAEWRNIKQNLNSLSNSAFANADRNKDKPKTNSTTNSRKKRQVPYAYKNCARLDWRTQAVIIVSKNDSLLNVETMQEAFDFVFRLRELLKCDMDDDLDAFDRFYCCDTWDLLRMKYEIFGQDEDDRTPAEVMTQFFSIITYPADKRFKLDKREQETIFTNSLGGVVRRDPNNGYNSRVTAVKAMQFIYQLPDNEYTYEAEAKMTRTLKELRKKYKTFDIYWETHYQTQDEFMNQIMIQELPKVALTFLCVILWCIIGALNSDALNSKPWFGLVGIVSTGMACSAGFGAQFWVGDTFQTYLIAVPLMALAIGLDDMFILMNAWLNTDPSLPREERAKHMMQEGGTSIFVTVMMTIIDFVVGTNVPYPAIQKYSDFALWTLAFDFFLQMTIFVSCLVMSDWGEKRTRQACFCCITVDKRTPKNVLEDGECGVMCCTYGRVEDAERDLREKEAKRQKRLRRKERKAALKAWQPERLYLNTQELRTEPPPELLQSDDENAPDGNDWTIHENLEDANEFSSGKRIIYQHVAPFLLNPITRSVIYLSGVFLVAFSLVVVVTRMEVGFHPAHLANRKSNTYDFKMADWEYFRDFTDTLVLEVLIDFETYEYNDNFTLAKRRVMEVVDRIEQWEQYIWGSRLNRVAFRDVRWALPDNETIPEWNWTISQGVQFYARRTSNDDLKPVLLKAGTDDERLSCLATFQIKNVSKLERGAELAQRLKELQAGYEREPGFNVYITDTIKVLRVFDQIVNLPSQFIYFAFITVASTVITSFVMIPNPICMFWMALSSMIIILGTLAGMTLCGVGLDPVSLVYLLMAIGGTADYICHCIYTFTVADPEVKVKPGEKPDWAKMRYAKARHLLGELVSETGPAVIGTTLSIVVLSTSFNYVLESFFKVFFVAVVTGIYFSVIVLPAVLCQFGPVAKQCCESEDTGEVAAVVDQSKVEIEYYYDEARVKTEAKPEMIVRKPKIPKQFPKLPSKMLINDPLETFSVAANGQIVKPIEGDYVPVAKMKLMRRFLLASSVQAPENISPMEPVDLGLKKIEKQRRKKRTLKSLKNFEIPYVNTIENDVFPQENPESIAKSSLSSSKAVKGNLALSKSQSRESTLRRQRNVENLQRANVLTTEPEMRSTTSQVQVITPSIHNYSEVDDIASSKMSEKLEK